MELMAKWVIKLFETPRGGKPVESFIRKQSSTTIAKILRSIDLLEKYGPRIGMPHSKKISQDLYELRIRGRQEIRILYTLRKHEIILLHGFRKQTRKTPRKEITTAQRRLENT